MLRALTSKKLSEADLQEEINAIQKIETKEQAATLKALVDYIKEQEGEKGLDKVKTQVEKCGVEFPDLKEIKHLDFIKDSTIVSISVTAAKLFNWDEKDFVKLGENLALTSFTAKVFLKMFFSFKSTLTRFIFLWNKNFTSSEMSLEEYDKKNKRIVIKVTDFGHGKTHPTVCPTIKGILKALMKVNLGSQNISVRETKCQFKGDTYHKFIGEW